MMDIVLLIIGIIIIILLVVLILRTGKENQVSFPSLDGVKSQLDVIQKDNRDSQSALRQEVSASIKENMSFLSRQVTENQKQASDEQIKMSKSQREQLDIIGTSQREELKAMSRNITNQLQQLESRFATLEKNTETKLENIRATMEKQLDGVRNDNTSQLEKVRNTVDEKLRTNLESMNGTISGNLSQLENRFATLEKNTETKLENIRATMEKQLDGVRNDNTSQLEKVRRTVDEKLQDNLDSMNITIFRNLTQLEKRFESLEKNTENKLENVRTSVESQLKNIREDNNKQLEQIRGTVDEKLQTTLENKMNESFKLVSERLEQVYKGLGEMQTVAQGVGDLKKVLSNVKTRGILGEIQLGAILKEILTPEQYEENIATVPKSSNRVEFAVKLPGADEGKYVYLPIDSKFNGDKFAYLQEAYETGDKNSVAEAKKELIDAVKKCAKDISEKYISPPYTTQFAIMFLPFEGLYAEIVNTKGLVEELQRTYKINVAGPSTMAAMLNSLKMGFQTLAIQKRSSEVWEVLGAVKTEFETFEKALTETQERLRKADDSLEKLVGVRTRQMNKKLSRIDKLDIEKTYKILETE